MGNTKRFLSHINLETFILLWSGCSKGSLLSKKTNTITLTNELGSKANLSFNYSASKYNSFTVAGSSANASGTYTATLEAGEGVTIVLVSNSGLSDRTATLTLSNISLTNVADNSNITFDFDSSYGSVTVGGTAVSSGAVVNIGSAAIL